jgi:hypothetical protein
MHEICSALIILSVLQKENESSGMFILTIENYGAPLLAIDINLLYIHIYILGI